MNISNKTKIVGVIGNPIDHTLSPSLHNKWALENSIDLIYLPLKVDDLKAFMNWFKSSNLFGFNVTIPHKESIIPFLDKLSYNAEKIGAVNTVIKKEDSLYGYNTDILGIKSTLEDHISPNSKVLVIGAGGACRALIYYLNSIDIVPYVQNRTVEKVIKLSQMYKLISIPDNIYENIFDCVINTTPIGMDNSKSPIDLDKFEIKPNYIFDMIYEPKVTPLLKQANQLKLNNCNGFNMLIEQAKQSFNIWTGIYPKNH